MNRNINLIWISSIYLSAYLSIHALFCAWPTFIVYRVYLCICFLKPRFFIQVKLPLCPALHINAPFCDHPDETSAYDGKNHACNSH